MPISIWWEGDGMLQRACYVNITGRMVESCFKTDVILFPDWQPVMETVRQLCSAGF